MAITQQDIIYFIITDRFFTKGKSVSVKGIDKKDPQAYHGGNLDGIIDKIPYLKNLGITVVWITPVYQQIERDVDGKRPYHGYWPLDFNKVDTHLYCDKWYEPGSKKYLKDLADALHMNGMKLMFDVVVNHAGYYHPGQTNQPNNPTPIRSDWFNPRGLRWQDNITKGELEGLPDFNLDQIDVIDYHIQSLLSWIEETGIDGIRMDTAKHIEKGFWNYFKTQVHGRYPDVTLIGEVFTYDVDELTEYQKYWGFDSLFDFPVQGAINRVFVEGGGLTEFESPFSNGSGIFERDNAYSNHNRLISILDNHDLPNRYMTAALNACGQDHEKAIRIMNLSLSFMFTTRGAPQIFYGTEVALEGGFDPDNRRDFPWEKIDTTNEVRAKYKNEKKIFDHLKNLISIRKKNLALSAGTHVCLYVDFYVYAFLNYFNQNIVITVLHNGWEPMKQPLTLDLSLNGNIPDRIKQILKNKKLICQVTGRTIQLKQGKFEISLDGKSSAILI